MTITLNGEEVPLDGPLMLADLISQRYGEPRGVAVAVDEAVVPRGSWLSYALVPGQRVEVVTAVQGG